MQGEDIVLAGKVEKHGTGCRVVLSDGQSIALASCPADISDRQVMVVVTTQDRYQADRRQLAKHLLAEILNGS